MTIKEFARLCNCNPQTLRYYDKLDLLKPHEVDNWTGYRYYSEQQAIEFVKIKNLQEADFSIKEIKELLSKEDDEVYRAFNRKIEEQAAKLEKIKQIQTTYLSEKQKMEAKIREIKETVMASALEYDPKEEFGISEESFKKLIGMTNDLFEASMKQIDTFDVDFSEVEMSDSDEIVEEAAYQNPLESGKYLIACEKHGWDKTKEVLDDLPKLDTAEYLFYFEVEKGKASNMAFCMVVMGCVLEQNEGMALHLNCNCTESKDGLNHFWLLKRKL